MYVHVECVRETEILVEQQPLQGVFVCDHAGLVINKFSPIGRRFSWFGSSAGNAIQRLSRDRNRTRSSWKTVTPLAKSIQFIPNP